MPAISESAPTSLHTTYGRCCGTVVVEIKSFVVSTEFRLALSNPVDATYDDFASVLREIDAKAKSFLDGGYEHEGFECLRDFIRGNSCVWWPFPNRRFRFS